MQRKLIWAGLALAALLLALWGFGALDTLSAWAIQAQHQVQDQLARAVRRLRGGEAGALAALLALCFAYGFLHAVGPGHGKALIGGYGVARRVRLMPLAGLALVSSLAQSLVAILLVYALVLALGWTRAQVEGLSDRWLMPLSQAAILLIGLWLIWRGWNHARQRPHEHHDHDHDHSGHHHHEHCNHAHGPSLDQINQLTSTKDAALLVASIAMRPCSGALFLLIITWSLGIATAGIAGVLAMGLGTACVTITVAALSVWAREGALLSLPERAARTALPLIEIGAGLIITAIAALMLARGLL
jgi:nickel/cobalt exporter